MRRTLSVLALTAALFNVGGPCPERATAQSVTPPSHSPDLLGIYMGMPAGAAKAQLQKHSSDVYVQYASPASDGFGISLPGMPTDQISVSITQAPNDPAVWKIQRDQGFSGLAPISRSALLDSLHRKYGQETFKKSPDTGYERLYWIFGQDGKLLSSADPGLMDCNPIAPTGMKPELAGPCNQNFFALYMQIISGGHDGDSVQSYTMVLLNLPFEARAAQLTANAKKSAADKAQRAEDRKKNSRPVPTF